MIKRILKAPLPQPVTLRQRGSFAQSFAVMFSAAAIAGVGVLVSPVMLRLCAPAAYEVFAVFNALVTT
ncbi:MAG TPA: hypothetical protein VF629_09750 [Hymenobacter sp.]|uniref:hypothetical protein n=1 Tax=Hymenobacter sp. TaxID=1898978 RepID=UPI002ED7D15D